MNPSSSQTTRTREKETSPSRRPAGGAARCLLVFALALAARASSPAQTSENQTEFVNPIITEEALPDEPGEATLRLGTDYRSQGHEATGSLLYADVCFGLIRRFGATVTVPLAFDKDRSNWHEGLGDISARLKFLALPPSRTLPAVVLGVEAAVPTGIQRFGLGEGTYELTPYVALLKELGPVVLQGDIDWSKQVTGAGKDAWSYNWAAAFPVDRRRLYLLLEVNGDWGGGGRAAVSPGFRYSFTEKFLVGAALPIGLNRRTEAWGVSTQVQYDF